MAPSGSPDKFAVVQKLKDGLIVSCQAAHGEPLCAPEHIAALALSAIAGGACAVRLEGIENISYLRSKTDLPIVGLTKDETVPESARLGSVYITPTFKDAVALVEAGADIVALDATGRPRKDDLSLVRTIEQVHNLLNKPVWADVATLHEAVDAYEAGVDIVSTTMYGYTKETALPSDAGPSFTLVKEMATALKDAFVIMEGRVWHPEDVAKAFENGAHAVVVGSAITRPILITQRFVRQTPKAKQK